MAERNYEDQCGDHGGTNSSGNPCGQAAGWGTKFDSGKCRQHRGTSPDGTSHENNGYAETHGLTSEGAKWFERHRDEVGDDVRRMVAGWMQEASFGYENHGNVLLLVDAAINESQVRRGDDYIRENGLVVESFDHIAEDGREVCKRCYTRVRERQPYPWIRGDQHGDRAAFVEYIDDGSRLGVYEETTTLDDRVQEAAPPDESGTTTACRCGAIETHRTPKTRSKADAVRAAAGISQTLSELDIAHDWLILLARVRELKSRPAYAGDDFRTFRRATAQAVHVARHGSVATFDD